MRYSLNRGVVLFRICDSWFLFPSRESEIKIGVLVSVSQELLSVLRDPDREIKEEELEEKTVSKLKRLARMNYIKEV